MIIVLKRNQNIVIKMIFYKLGTSSDNIAGPDVKKNEIY